MADQKITKRTVDAAEPRDSRYTIFDSLIPGFGLRVYPSGQKSWVFEYRTAAGGRTAAKKRATIGKVGDFTPDQARKEADRLRTVVKTGGDPQSDKSAFREAPTVADVVKAFMTDHVEAKRGTGTQVHYQDIFDRIVIPALGKVKAHSLDGADVARLHKAWKHTPFQANRILSAISAAYNFASAPSQKMIPKGTNPVTGIEKFPEPSRQRLLSSAELVNIGTTLRLAETTGIPWKVRDEKATSKHLAADDKRFTVISPHAAAAVRLLLFTGARLREILNLRWDEVDFERGMLLLGKHKTVRSTGIKAIVLNAPALEVLSGIERMGVYVIASESAGTENEKPRADLKKPWAAIRDHAGLGDVRLNDLRHNFASFGAGGGMGLPVIGKLLGHTQASTTSRYAHLHSDPLRNASNAIGSAVAAAMGEGQPTAQVIPIEKARKG